MASHVYTLSELVDLGLRTPEIGAVNFNIIRIVLHKILLKCELQNVTAEWRPMESRASIGKIMEDKELPDHPILRRIEKPQDGGEMAKQSAGITKVAPSAKKAVQIPGQFKTLLEEDISTKQGEITDMREEESVSESGKSAETKTGGEAEFELDASSKGLKVGSSLWHLWQLKKMTKKVEAFEETLSSIIDKVDDLEDFKESRMKRLRFEEGEGLESKYSGPVVGREEFEDTIEELGEALTRVSIKLRQQKEESLALNQDILKEICLKASLEDLTRSKESLTRKLRTLSIAVRKIQKVIKDVIYPEACGTTKCVACSRKAHLPFRCLVMDTRRKLCRKKSGDSWSGENALQVRKAPTELKFTRLSLERSTLEEADSYDDSGYREVITQNVQEEYSEKPIDPACVAAFESFSRVSKISRDFAPLRVFPDLLRRNVMYVPTIRRNEVPVAAEEMGIFIKKYSEQ